MASKGVTSLWQKQTSLCKFHWVPGSYLITEEPLTGDERASEKPPASALFLMLPWAPHSPASQSFISWAQRSPCFDLFSALLSAFHPGHQTPSRAKSPTSVCFLHRFPWGRSHPDSRAPGSRERTGSENVLCSQKRTYLCVLVSADPDQRVQVLDFLPKW